MGSLGPATHFRKIQQFDTDYSPSTFTQYESEQTGMRVVVVDREGPKLNGYFVLATEIHDDSGAPHTLEHLCFMGSKSFRYKGFLDKLATRAYSSTNAWTATDHTAYTLETAGWAGFAQMLPVYLDHLILPTITDSGCITEVHHIDGDGNDAGVVYSEMQGVQNTASELVALRARRLIYPEGVGFRYETGGMMEALRGLSADRIRNFHREMYQPKNLCLVLFGEIDHTQLLDLLEKFESSILPDIPEPNKPFSRPWIDSRQAPPLEKTIYERVEFPEEDETFGLVSIRYLGPDCTDAVQTAALDVVTQYLCGSAASPLDNNLVEKEQLASSIVVDTDARPRTEISFGMTGVETHMLETAEKRFHEILQRTVAESLDMAFMQDCIDRQVRSLKYTAESSATSMADAVIADYLFGNRDGSTLTNMGTLSEYTTIISSWTESQWKDFIIKYLIDAHHVSLLGVPSAKLSQKLKSEEAARLEQQKTELGPEGLRKKVEELEAAKKENDREIPSELLARFKVPPTESIHFINTSSARSGPAVKIGRPNNRYQRLIESNDSSSPLFIDFEHITSNFARVHLIVSTETLPLRLRPLLSIYLEAFFNLPVKRGSEVIDFEKVVVEVERDTVGYTIDSASALGNAECLRITLQVEIEKYQVAINWLRELLWDSIFDIKRLYAINARLLADVPDAKRDGNDMMSAVHVMAHRAPKSIGRARSTLVGALFLKRIKQLLKSDPEMVVQDFEELRETMCRFENFRVLVIADLEKLKDPVASWQSFLKDLDTSKPLCHLGKRIERLSEAGEKPGQLAYVVPMPTIDSSFLLSLARGPSSWSDPRIPALMVASSYLNAVEGPLWVAVRGVGLAYGVSMNYDIESGYVSLDVYRSPDAYKAFEASRKVVQDHIDGAIDFDPLMVEGAISGIVMAFANEQETLARAAGSKFVKEVMRELPEDFNEQLLKKVRDVSIPQLKEALHEIVFEAFRPGKADVICTCGPALQESIKTGLKSAGFKPEVHDLVWFQDDYGWKADDEADGEDDEDEDEDEDEEGEDDEEGEEGSEGFTVVDRTDGKKD